VTVQRPEAARTEAAERVARLLGIALGARHIYGEKHPRAGESVNRVAAFLEEHFHADGDPLDVTFDASLGCVAADGALLENRSPFTALAAGFERRGCGGLGFAAAMPREAVEELVVWLSSDEDTGALNAAGVRTLRGDDPVCRLAERVPEFRTPLRIRKTAVEALLAAMDDARAGRPLDVERLNRLAAEVAEEVFESGTRILGPVLLMDNDAGTYQHSVNVFLIAATLLHPLSNDPRELAALAQATFLHDIGKCRISEDIIEKNGPLTDKEFEVVKEHPRLGAEILMEQRGLHPAAIEVAYCHHMRDDGLGYPERRGPVAPGPITNIVQIADMFEALTARRSYRDSLPVAEALSLIASTPGMGSKQAALTMLRGRLAEAPVGAQVGLTSGERAVVVSQNLHRPGHPVVRVFTDAEGNPLTTPFVVDLAAENEDCTEEGRAISDVVLRPGQAPLA
jgi:putative nucleotidyltransferase with HDIG domain